MTSADDMPRRYIIHTMARDGVSKLPYQVASPLSCVISGGPAPILRLVNEVKPEKAKKRRILTFADAISMTTGP